MSNGTSLLIVNGFAWAALVLAMLGRVMKRFDLTRKMGVVFEWLAVLPYALGFAGTAAMLYSLHGKDGWVVLALIIAGISMVPLVLVTVLFGRSLAASRNVGVCNRGVATYRTMSTQSPNPSIERT